MGMDASFYTANFEPEELASLYRGTVNEWSAAGQANARLPQGIGEAVGFYSGNFTTSAGDYAKLIAMLANDGIYEGVRYLDAASVEELERPRLTADNGESVFDQCLALRRKEGIYGQDTLYYHTGSAYGVYALMSYNPETKNGVVVISTGADRAVDENGSTACAPPSPSRSTSRSTRRKETYDAKMDDPMGPGGPPAAQRLRRPLPAGGAGGGRGAPRGGGGPCPPGAGGAGAGCGHPHRGGGRDEPQHPDCRRL